RLNRPPRLHRIDPTHRVRVFDWAEQPEANLQEKSPPDPANFRETQSRISPSRCEAGDRLSIRACDLYSAGILEMSEDIPFNRTLDLAPGVVDNVAPGVRRILADNPGPFTFKGTLSYIIGRGNVAIIDPGPLDQRHTAALLDAVRCETV